MRTLFTVGSSDVLDNSSRNVVVQQNSEAEGVKKSSCPGHPICISEIVTLIQQYLPFSKITVIIYS